MREQVEALEHDADVAAQGVDIDAGAADPVVVQADLAALDRLEAVDAAQQGGLAAARGADQADHLMRLDVEVDALQHLDGAVALVDVLDLDQGHQPPRVRRWSRSSSRSTQRACGMVMITNRKATVVTEDRLKWLLATILD